MLHQNNAFHVQSVVIALEAKDKVAALAAIEKIGPIDTREAANAINKQNHYLPNSYGTGTLLDFCIATYPDKDIIAALLQKGAHPCIGTDNAHTVNTGNTALHIAAGEGRLGAVEALLQYAAPLQLRLTKALNWNGYTPLHWAAANGDVATIQRLVKEDVSAVQKPNRKKQLPIHIALEAGHVEAVEAFLKFYPANSNILIASEKNEAEAALLPRKNAGWSFSHCLAASSAPTALVLIPILQAHGLSFSEIDQNGRTPFFIATTQQNLPMMQALHKIAPATIDLADKHQTTPLMQAFAALADQRQDKTPISLEIINFLLANTNLKAAPYVERAASIRDDPYGVLSKLLEPTLGLDVNTKNPANGRTALQTATCAGALESFKLLVRKGANLTEKDDNGRTLLHLATIHKQKDVVMYLLGLEPPPFDMEEKDGAGKTAYQLCLEMKAQGHAYDYLLLPIEELLEPARKETLVPTVQETGFTTDSSNPRVQDAAQTAPTSENWLLAGVVRIGLTILWAIAESVDWLFSTNWSDDLAAWPSYKRSWPEQEHIDRLRITSAQTQGATTGNSHSLDTVLKATTATQNKTDTENSSGRMPMRP